MLLDDILEKIYQEQERYEYAPAGVALPEATSTVGSSTDRGDVVQLAKPQPEAGDAAA